MRPTAHLPRLIAATVLLVCLLAATPAAARRPALAITSSAALDATAKVPFQYESFWPLVLLRVPWLALPHPLAPVAVGKTPALPVMMPPQILEPIRRRPSVEMFCPEQIFERTRRTPAHPVMRPPEILEPVRKTPSLEVFAPAQIGR
jgi:hypothetical protein